MEKISLVNIIQSPGFSRSFKEMFRYSYVTEKEASIISHANHQTGDFIFDIAFGTFGAMAPSHSPIDIAKNRQGYSFNQYGKKLDESRATTITGKIDDSSEKDFLNSTPVYCLDLHTHPENKEDLHFSYGDLTGYLGGMGVSNKKLNFIPLFGIVAAVDKNPTALLYRPGSMTELDWCIEDYDEGQGNAECLQHLRDFGRAEIIEFNKDGTLSKKDLNIIKSLSNY